MAVKSSLEIAGSTDQEGSTGMVLPFQPLSLAFNHVSYYVDMPAVSHSILNIAFFCATTTLSYLWLRNISLQMSQVPTILAL